jgi:hypothetical protein
MFLSIDDQNSFLPDGGDLLKYEMTPTEELKPARRNARKHSARQIEVLARSMAEVGTISPIIIDGDNRIVAGHARWEAAKLLGLKAVPTLKVDHLNDVQIRLYALADNRIAECATWDETARAEEFRELRLEMPDLDLTISGFELPRIEFDIAGLEQTNWSDLDQQLEELPLAPVTHVGDTYDFTTGHTLVCGNSLDPDVVALAVGGETVQVAAEDPPYNLRAREYSGNGRYQHGDFLAEAHMAVLPHLADGALIYRYIDGKHIADVIEAGRRVGFTLKNVIVWDKGKGSMGSMYRHAHELVVLFKHCKARHINNVMLGKHGRDRHDIWRYPGMNRFGKGRDRALSIHATVKPVQMICDLLLDASLPGDVVFDGFSGSGTTLIATEKTGRRAKVIELEPRYCDVAIERFRRAFGAEPTERSTGLNFSQLTELRANTADEEAADVQ